MTKRYILVNDNLNIMSGGSNKLYYFDNNSTTLIYDKKVKKEINDWLSCGNASNVLHKMGNKAHNKIQQCREWFAKDMSVDPEEIYFTSGATESNNMIIQGRIQAFLNKDDKAMYTVISTAFEHPSVFNIMEYFRENPRLEMILVKPNINNDNPTSGVVMASDVFNAIKSAKHQVILVSVMFANNETGAIQDISKIGKICRKRNIFFHSDATQALGKYIIRPKELNADAISFSAHKFHGPKGIGGLFFDKEHHHIRNFCYGGEQEHLMRPGTENVALIAGMTKALEIAHINRKNKNKKLMKLWEYIWDKINDQTKISIIGPKNNELRLPNTLFISLEDLGTCNKLLVKDLSKKNICISVGSACQTGKKKPSHILDSMGITKQKDKIKVVRISFSDYTTRAEADYLIKHLVSAIKKTHN
jgi:cysteine desulfurase